MDTTLLQIEDLHVSFLGKQGELKVIRGLNYDIKQGETLGVVGESGCGKSVTSLAILRLLGNNGKIPKGRIVFKGTDMLKLSEEKMRSFRGHKVAMIFQEPMTALNPVLTIGKQICEQINTHQNLSKSQQLKRAVELLDLVGIPSANKRVHQYPHQLSGGMRQRAMIAMALSCNPDLLIADEPTTALDVTIQAQILELLQQLQRDFGMAIQFITHDMGVISEISDRIMVMYAGIIVEKASAEEIFHNPKHPYTVGLLNAIPSINKSQKRLNTIEGTVPNLRELPKGCPFQNRCPRVLEVCRTKDVILEEIKPGHEIACFNPVP